MSESASPVRLPCSTYRLQIHYDFPLTRAAEIVPYLHKLGVGDAYTSPLLAATTGSLHGYDATDPGAVSPDAGGDAGLTQFHAALQTANMGHLLDIVPNHMAAVAENRWWADVLMHGESSPVAEFFDINFANPPRPADQGRVVLPILGEPSAQAIANGQVRLTVDDLGVIVMVYNRRVATDPRTLHLVLAGMESRSLAEIARAAEILPPRTDPAGHAPAARLAGRLADLLRTPGTLEDVRTICAAITADPARFDQVLAAQAYRLTHWRAGADEVNYRRFFDISDLVALRADRAEVFAATHALVLDWLAAGTVTGLRIDHPDGLADPAGYLTRLRNAGMARVGRVPYVVVEKILAHGEPVRPDWATAGATGYEFINAVTGLLVDPAGEEGLTRCYERFTGRSEPLEDLIVRCKKLVLDTSFGGDLNRVVDLFFAGANSTRESQDFTRTELHTATRELIANFGAYRTYVTTGAVEADRALVAAAAAAARDRLPTHAPAIQFLADALTLDAPGDRTTMQHAVLRFQQLTAPATAKGFEDTALYRYARLLALNEVGSEPAEFGWTPASLHEFFQTRPAGSLNPLSTHDTKRGEDARARLCVLSEIPTEWTAAVTRWAELNAAHTTTLENGQRVPEANTEYIVYQTLVGAWPRTPADRATLMTRLQAFLVKALHEAKEASSWRDPDADYDSAACEFVEAILDPKRSREFLADMARFSETIARPAALNSLAQTLIRLMAPGVPDTYQGTELWDDSLVDPDNRRPIDYELRAKLLAELDAADAIAVAAELAVNPTDPRAKLFLTSRALRFRRDHPELFAAGRYGPLTFTGPGADRVFGFFRRYTDQLALIVVPRLTVNSDDSLRGTTIDWSGMGHRELRWNCVLTGASLNLSSGVTVAELFARFPVALLSTDLNSAAQ